MIGSFDISNAREVYLFLNKLSLVMQIITTTTPTKTTKTTTKIITPI